MVIDGETYLDNLSANAYHPTDMKPEFPQAYMPDIHWRIPYCKKRRGERGFKLREKLVQHDIPRIITSEMQKAIEEGH